jgi:hypothetical protein
MSDVQNGLSEQFGAAIVLFDTDYPSEPAYVLIGLWVQRLLHGKGLESDSNLFRSAA